MYGIIYLITNSINNKKYVGQTVKTLEIRWFNHIKDSYDRAKKKKMPILHAIKKYGKENFKIIKICECDTLEELNKKELYYANLYKSFSPNGYNLKAGNGLGSMSQETKDKISKALKGRKFSDEHKKNLSESHMGHIVSEQTKKKLSKINKGKRPSKLAQKNLIKSVQKEYVFISPNGEKVEIINLRQFCIKNNLSASKMVLVNQGKRNHHKNWKSGK